MPINTFFIDLDDTLYEQKSGLWPVIKNRITLYMQERMHLPEEIVPKLRKELFETYGTTLRGLKTVYNIDEHDFLDFVHDVPVKEYLQPNDTLRTMLESMPQRKIIFTNADNKHAARVIDALGLSGIFEKIIDIIDIWPYCKPQAEAFDLALQMSNTAANETLFADDSLPNILTAKKMGFFTVYVSHAASSDIPHATIEELKHLPVVFKNHEGKHAG